LPGADPIALSRGFHPDGLGRFGAFVGATLRLLSAPPMTYLSGLMERRGQVPLISSGALDSLPAEWPHLT
jgi:hypothetical protein